MLCHKDDATLTICSASASFVLMSVMKIVNIMEGNFNQVVYVKCNVERSGVFTHVCVKMQNNQT